MCVSSELVVEVNWNLENNYGFFDHLGRILPHDPLESLDGTVIFTSGWRVTSLNLITLKY